MKPLELILQVLLVPLLRDAIHSGRFRPIQRREACAQVVHREVVHQRRERGLWLAARPSSYPLDSRGRRSSTSGCGRRRHRAGTHLCPPLLRGRYPASTLVWGHPTSYGPLGGLPVGWLCHPTPVRGGVHRTSRVPDVALCTCYGLRPRWVRGGHGRRPL